MKSESEGNYINGPSVAFKVVPRNITFGTNPFLKSGPWAVRETDFIACYWHRKHRWIKSTGNSTDQSNEQISFSWYLDNVTFAHSSFQNDYFDSVSFPPRRWNHIGISGMAELILEFLEWLTWWRNEIKQFWVLSMPPSLSYITYGLQSFRPRVSSPTPFWMVYFCERKDINSKALSASFCKILTCERWPLGCCEFSCQNSIFVSLLFYNTSANKKTHLFDTLSITVTRTGRERTDTWAKRLDTITYMYIHSILVSPNKRTMYRVLTDNDNMYFALWFEGRNSDKSVVLQQKIYAPVSGD